MERTLIIRTVKNQKGTTYCAPGFRRFVPRDSEADSFTAAAKEQEDAAQEWLKKGKTP